MIWRCYFLKELAKIFSLIVGAFYFLYILIDISTHSKAIFCAPLLDVFLYYLFLFTKRADILIPVALMLSAIKVLTTLNRRNELVAMRSGGVPIKRLLTPLITTALLCVALLYLNNQFLQPSSLTYVEAFEQLHFKTRLRDEQPPPVHTLPLKDNSLLLYQQFASDTQIIRDAYWLKSPNEILRIHTLHPNAAIPFGESVDRLYRTSTGAFERQSSYPSLDFPDMQFDEKALLTSLHPPNAQSLTQLFGHLHISLWGKKLHDRDAKVATHFFHKLMNPWTCLLAVLAPLPFCIHFSRHLSSFMITALSLFALIAFFTLVNSALILGENQVIPPLWAILAVFFPPFMLCGYRYVKL